MFIRLAIARIAPYFPPVGAAPETTARSEQRERASVKIVLGVNLTDEPRFQGMMR
jgi:hypothetical protein